MYPGIQNQNVEFVISEVAEICVARIGTGSAHSDMFQKIIRVISYAKSIRLIDELIMVEAEKEVDLSNPVERIIHYVTIEKVKRAITIEIEVEKFVYRSLEDRSLVESTIRNLLEECVSPSDEFRNVRITYRANNGYSPRSHRFRMREWLNGKYRPSNNGHVNDSFPQLIYFEGFTFKSQREVALYNRLKDLQVLFAPLPAFSYRLNGHVKRVEPDFMVMKGDVRLLIEVDGESHEADTPEMQAERRAQFELSGFRELRFTNQQIDNDLDGVMRVIEGHLDPPQTTEP